MNGSLVIVSHSIIDFLDESVKMYGQAILDMATYKILMGTDGKNLEDTMELFKLTESQAEFLANKKRGYAIAEAAYPQVPYLEIIEKLLGGNT